VFERFARGGSTIPGVGLGLSIVKRAMESHRGTITLSNHPQEGLVVTLHLPEMET
jgi:two-component system sensor histidine kinase TctE